MARNVRPFWIDCDIDGRGTSLSGGPKALSGGMNIVLKQRSKGGITTAFRIDCEEDVDGRLVTTIRDGDSGDIVATKVTEK